MILGKGGSQVAGRARQRAECLEDRHLDEAYRLGRTPYFAYLGRPHELGQKPVLARRRG